jgi:hypothetical protein
MKPGSNKTFGGMSVFTVRKAMFALVCGAFFAAIGVCPAMSAEARRHALLIGVQDYSGTGFGSLSGTRNDVSLVRDLLTRERFGFKPSDITELLDERATHGAVLAAIGALAERAERDDIVYIHYSGHGSTARDANGDEKHESGEDSTFVAFGARRGVEAAKQEGAARGSTPAGLDDYDILDDEIEAALSVLAAKTRHVVFVADACHSGTSTRGTDVVATRGIDSDPRPHPAENSASPADARASWIAVGAAKDDELAREYRAGEKENGTERVYGAFTWFWVKALETSASDDTWQLVFDRAKVMMKGAGLSQNPEIEGDGAKMKVFGGIGAIPKKFTVTRVYPVIEVNAGSFAGISEGSEFQLERNGALTGTKLTVKKASPFTCEAAETASEGEPLKIGETVVLTKWQPSFPKIRLAFKADFPVDEPRLSELREIIAGDQNLAAYEFADTSGKIDMLLLVARRERNENGETAAAETAEPEIWFMDHSQESPYNGLDALKITGFGEQGMKDMTDNLARLANLKGFLDMDLPEGNGGDLRIQYKLYTAVSEDEWKELPPEERFDKETKDGAGNRLRWKLSRVVPAEEGMADRRPDEGLLSVSVKNNSKLPYYIYGINATREAKITPFLPRTNRGDTEVKAGENRDFTDLTHVLLLEENEEYVRVIASGAKTDISMLAQDAIIMRDAARIAANKGNSNPIEAMLTQHIYPTRGDFPVTDISPEDLSSRITSFVIPGDNRSVQ